MIRVMLVEDEWLVREGLRRMIPWQEQGFEIAGEADNGDAALELFKRLRPDVVFTDIRMPGMDGMTLIAHIRELSPKVPICVLSSHTDFNLVKQGFRHGVFEYLDKVHLSSGEIEQCLGRLRELLGSQTDGADAGKAESAEETGKPAIEFSPLSYLKANRREQDAKGHAGWVWAITELEDPDIGSWGRTIQWSDFPLQAALRDNRVFVDASGRVHAILREGAEEPAAIHAWMEGYCKCALALSGSVVASAWEEAFRQAEELCADFFYTGWQTRLRYEQRRHYKLGQIPLEPRMSEEMARLLAVSKPDECLRHLGEAIDEADRQGVHPRSFKQAVAMLLVRGSRPERVNQSGMNWGETVSQLVKCRTKDEFLQETAGFLRAFADRAPIGDFSKAVSGAIASMERHMAEKITLQRLAQEAFLNPNYFATLFKEQTGRTPMGYLTELRMNRAKELLLRKDLLIQEIAEQVGFVNLSHFSKQFKQATGKSPTDYRG
ncbi:helix-turn-helix domain-containing protein [Paenibacillus methanolicus]|uniref:YesN/AraC family two-component response regulator n=1 Tax=Paenibacillus methanolicus TaxID=582686 RepID=A0A5S5C170_9BACL|nr:response regulator [Paenibacillus methanolicus]TYP73171.1 YesN/AraC family two-component response regulator [Paenibacillus methanolicus]